MQPAADSAGAGLCRHARHTAGREQMDMPALPGFRPGPGKQQHLCPAIHAHQLQLPAPLDNRALANLCGPLDANLPTARCAALA